MVECGICMPNFSVHLTPDGEYLPCIREDGHTTDYDSDLSDHHLVRLNDGRYIVWYHDYEDVYPNKDDEDFVYLEISEEEAREKYLPPNP